MSIFISRVLMKHCAKQLLVWDKPLNYIDVTFNAYAGQTRQPDIEAEPNSLKLVLRRRGEKRYYLETKI